MINIEELEKDQQQVIEKADVDTLASYCRELQTYEEEIAELEEQIKKKREKADKISSEIIPNMLAEQGISSLKLADGSSVDVRKSYNCTIKKDEMESAYNWLRENGLGDLIKNEVTVAFGRSEDNKAQQYAVLAQGQGYEPVQKLKVEPMTLKALVRERLESGQEMPSDLFNVFAGNRTKVTRSK